MDMMLLVVDATKGVQAQTTECVVIGEAVMASGADVVVVLNKVGAPLPRRAGITLSARSPIFLERPFFSKYVVLWGIRLLYKTCGLLSMPMALPACACQSSSA